MNQRKGGKMDLEGIRLENANSAFDLYDLGEAVKGNCGWTHFQYDDLWRRPILCGYVERMFVVRFVSNSGEVDEAYVE